MRFIWKAFGAARNGFDGTAYSTNQSFSTYRPTQILFINTFTSTTMNTDMINGNLNGDFLSAENGDGGVRADADSEVDFFNTSTASLPPSFPRSVGDIVIPTVENVKSEEKPEFAGEKSAVEAEAEASEVSASGGSGGSSVGGGGENTSNDDDELTQPPSQSFVYPLTQPEDVIGYEMDEEVAEGSETKAAAAAAAAAAEVSEARCEAEPAIALKCLVEYAHVMVDVMHEGKTSLFLETLNTVVNERQCKCDLCGAEVESAVVREKAQRSDFTLPPTALQEAMPVTQTQYAMKEDDYSPVVEESQIVKTQEECEAEAVEAEVSEADEAGEAGEAEVNEADEAGEAVEAEVNEAEVNEAGEADDIEKTQVVEDSQELDEEDDIINDNYVKSVEESDYVRPPRRMAALKTLSKIAEIDNVTTAKSSFFNTDSLLFEVDGAEGAANDDAVSVNDDDGAVDASGEGGATDDSYDSQSEAENEIGQCKKVKGDGVRCIYTENGSGFCGHHDKRRGKHNVDELLRKKTLVQRRRRKMKWVNRGTKGTKRIRSDEVTATAEPVAKRVRAGAQTPVQTPVAAAENSSVNQKAAVTAPCDVAREAASRARAAEAKSILEKANGEISPGEMLPSYSVPPVPWMLYHNALLFCRELNLKLGVSDPDAIDYKKVVPTPSDCIDSICGIANAEAGDVPTFNLPPIPWCLFTKEREASRRYFAK